MKKHWKSIVALIVIIGGIGTYYGHAALDAKSYPGLVLEWMDGEEKYVEPVVIAAQYWRDTHLKYMQISKDDYVYRDHESIYQQQKGVAFSYERNLQARYPALLRGPNRWQSQLIENEQYVVMARLHPGDLIQQQTNLHVKYVDKQSNQIRQMTHTIEQVNLFLDDIEIVNDELMVFIRSLEYRDRGHEQDLNTVSLYSFDMVTGQFDEQTTIFSEAIEAFELSKLRESVHWQPKPYIVYRKIPVQRAQLESQADRSANIAVRTAHEEHELLAYDVRTGAVQTIRLPEPLQNQYVNLFDGTNLYFTQSTDQETKVTVFSIATGEVINELSIPYNVTEGDSGHPPLLTVYDGFIYKLDHQVNQDVPAHLVVIEAATGKVVSRAQIVSTQTDPLNPPYDIDFYSIQLGYPL